MSMASYSPPNKTNKSAATSKQQQQQQQQQQASKQAPGRILDFSSFCFKIKPLFFHIDCYIKEQLILNLFSNGGNGVSWGPKLAKNGHFQQLSAENRAKSIEGSGFSPYCFKIKRVFSHIDCHIKEQNFPHCFCKRRQSGLSAAKKGAKKGHFQQFLAVNTENSFKSFRFFVILFQNQTNVFPYELPCQRANLPQFLPQREAMCCLCEIKVSSP